VNITYENELQYEESTDKLFCWATTIKFPCLHNFPTLGLFPDLSRIPLHFQKSCNAVLFWERCYKYKWPHPSS